MVNNLKCPLECVTGYGDEKMDNHKWLDYLPTSKLEMQLLSG
ncbi:MAG: hypothetical protein Q8N08_07075 [Methanobacteriaceae archaeon]|nr:hypothetical protein [Methanobacteriaceae archaeon]